MLSPGALYFDVHVVVGGVVGGGVYVGVTVGVVVGLTISLTAVGFAPLPQYFKVTLEFSRSLGYILKYIFKYYIQILHYLIQQ